MRTVWEGARSLQLHSLVVHLHGDALGDQCLRLQCGGSLVSCGGAVADGGVLLRSKNPKSVQNTARSKGVVPALEHHYQQVCAGHSEITKYRRSSIRGSRSLKGLGRSNSESCIPYNLEHLGAKEDPVNALSRVNKATYGAPQIFGCFIEPFNSPDRKFRHVNGLSDHPSKPLFQLSPADSCLLPAA